MSYQLKVITETLLLKKTPYLFRVHWRQFLLKKKKKIKIFNSGILPNFKVQIDVTDCVLGKNWKL